MRAANAAAAVVVGKRGTATVSLAELRRRILPAASLAPEEKIVFDWSVLDERLAEWRRHGLAHRLHQRLLRSAASAAISSCWRRRAPPATGWSSASTAMPRSRGSRARAGRSRTCMRAPKCWPRSRRSISSSCSSEDTPLELIKRVRPTVLVKGGDYSRDEVVGREVVEAARRRRDPGRSGARPQHHHNGRAHASGEGLIRRCRPFFPIRPKIGSKWSSLRSH